MTRKEIIEKNLEQHSIFMSYALDHPEILEKIPNDTQIIFLPIEDSQLTKLNLQHGKAQEAKGKLVTYIKTKITKEKRTVLVPQLEIASV